jgi:hypothetical protein
MTTEYALKPETRDRAEIPEEYTWDLNQIYPDWDAWEKDLGRLQAQMDTYQELKGTLAEGPQRILEASLLSDELGQLAYRVYQYPGLMQSQDTRDNVVQARLEQVRLALAAFRQATAWYTPELLEIPEETMQGWLDETPELAPYRFGIEESYRMQQHVLDEDGERLLAFASTFAGTPAQTYSMLADADVSFSTVILSDGSEVVASHANYSHGLHTLREQADREKLFKAHFTVFDEYPNTYAAIYNGILQKDWFTARSRRYESALEAKLDDDNIPVAVVEALIDTARGGSGYHRLRKKALGLEKYRYFDAYLPLVEVEWALPYDAVGRLVIDSVEVFGGEYQRTVERSFAERWIDVYENEGKRSGAFSAGVYGVHPYMLLNYADTLNDAFTVAHEMGHTMHTVLSHESQRSRDGSHDAHRPVPRKPALCHLVVFDIRRGGRVDGQRVPLPRSAACRGGGPGTTCDAAPARHRRHCSRLLPAGDVRRLRAAGPQRGRGRPPDHRRGSARDLPRGVGELLRRRARRSAVVPQYLGPDSALLRLAVLRLPVCDVEGGGGVAPPEDDRRRGRGAFRHRRSLPRAVAFGRQRPSH